MVYENGLSVRLLRKRIRIRRTSPAPRVILPSSRRRSSLMKTGQRKGGGRNQISTNDMKKRKGVNNGLTKNTSKSLEKVLEPKIIKLQKGSKKGG